ncbi:MAG: HlyD family efflux transporter periplasmic adaptor subunit [Bacteroidales bacterium]|nr:HlyD family efflux transporter periplasmic adaptor subunit [Bacteroidales bacterium]
MNIRKFLFGLTILILIGAVSYLSMVYLTSLKKKPEPPRVKKNIPLVKTQKVSYSNFSVDIVKQGRLSSNHKVELISEVQGKILSGDLPLKSGQSFKKGDLLFKIYDEEAKLALRASKSRFLTSVANVLPDIKYDFEQNYDAWMLFFNSIDLNSKLPELPKIKSEQEKIYLAGKNIFNDYFTIQSSEIRLAKYQVYAPFNGSFSQVYFQEGSIANPGTRVASIIRTDLLELEVSIQVEDVKWLKKDMSVDLLMNNKKIGSGKVSRISDFVDVESQSVLVYVNVPNSNNQKLYEGMYLDARFYGFKLNNVMKAPRAAVFNFDEVYLVKDNKLHKTRVNIVKVEQENLYISGLEEGGLLAVDLPLSAIDLMDVRTQEMKK